MDSETTAPPSPSNYRGRGRGRGRGRRSSDSLQQPDAAEYGQGGRGHTRGRGRGRGRGPHNAAHNQNVDLSSGRPPGGSFGARLTEAAPQEHQDDNATQMDAPLERKQSVAEDAEVCFICASPVDHISIAPCNHQTCHICSLRLRALYKTRACAHCRTESPFVVFTDSPDKRFQDFVDTEFVKIDSNLGIKYEKDEILEDTILLLRYNCPDKECDVACLGWPDLHRHVKNKHNKVMCDLCTRNKKVFTHEHELFTFADLRRHEKYGDDTPGAIDQSGFKGHPECGFCRQRFYGDDELYSHCRERHERCHICDRRNGGRNPQYYLNYEQLEKHFADAHFLCLDAECQANKTNVFESEMDLKAHQLSEHPNGLTKDARRDARLVNLSGFDVRTPYQPERRGGRSNRDREPRGNARGRDPNADPLPVSSAQPLSRAEQAFQRTLAIQSSQNVTSRNFGGQLTQAPARQTASTQPPPPALPTSSNPVPELDTFTIAPTTDPTNMTTQDRARLHRHEAVITRATTLLKNNPTKMSHFRTSVSSYRQSKITAPDLIEAFFSLFDCSSSDLGKLMRELADLFEDETKRQSLLEAWNSWRSINEDYPSLPGPSGTGVPGSTSASINSYSSALNSAAKSIDLAASLGANVSTGRRVLKLKSSTAQSHTAAAANSARLSRIGPSAEAFPSLSAAASTSSALRPQGHHAPYWPNSQPNTTSTHISTIPFTTAKPNGTPSAAANSKAKLPATMSTRRNEEMFPSLPKTAKPNVMISGFNTKGSGRLTGSGTNTPNNLSPWAIGGRTPTPLEAQAAVEAAVAAAASGDIDDGRSGKKKGKKKETLFHFG